MGYNSEDMAAYMRNRRKERREKLLILGGGKCTICGSTEDLEFNHRDRLSKRVSLSGKGLDIPWADLLIEIEKCDLLCRPHHLEYTRQQYANGEIRPHNAGLALGPAPHGTTRKYDLEKCRCDHCKKARSLYRIKAGYGFSEVVPMPE